MLRSLAVGLCGCTVACLLTLGLPETSHAQLRMSLLGNPEVAPLGLETVWATHARVDPSRGRLASLQLMHGLLLAQSDQGTIQAIDPETGRTLWAVAVGNADYETMPPSANKEYVAVTNGTTLYLLDRTNGAVVWESRCGGPPCAGSGMNETRVYVPLDSGIVEAYLLNREKGSDRIPKRYSGAGGAIAAPIVVGKRASWSVSQGYVYSNEETFEDLVQFRYKVDDDLSSPPTYMEPYLYAASRRGTVYCLDGVQGKEVWRFAAGTSITHPPIAVDGALYFITEHGEMVRLDPRFVRQIWAARGIKRFVAQSKDRVYVVDTANRLQARDAATGLLIGAVSVAGFELASANLQSDRIYLASPYGVVQCLREARLATPLAHTPGFAIPPPPKPGDPAPAADPSAAPVDPAAPAPAAGANPFGS